MPSSETPSAELLAWYEEAKKKWPEDHPEIFEYGLFWRYTGPVTFRAGRPLHRLRFTEDHVRFFEMVVSEYLMGLSTVGKPGYLLLLAEQAKRMLAQPWVGLDDI